MESQVPLRTLVPYSWAGEWPTSFRFASDNTLSKPSPTKTPLKVLSFIHKKGKTVASFQIETIVLHNHDKDQSSSQENSSTNTLLTGSITILFVISGHIKVSVDGGKTSNLLKEQDTLVCERGTQPTDVIMTPLLKPTQPGTKVVEKGGLVLATVGSGDENDAVVLIIQVHLVPTLKSESVLNIPPLSPVPLNPANVNDSLPPRPTRNGSIIVFDDQPMWNLPIATNTNHPHSAVQDPTYSTIDSPISPTSSLPPPPPSSSAQTGGGGLQTKYFESAQHYRPPVFSNRYRNESEVPPPIIRDSLVIEDFPIGVISTAWINMVKQGLSEWIRVPVIVARGTEPGPVIGITAVVHGNELNGVPCIHRVITDIDVSELKGSVVAVPCVNVPGYLRFSREFSDGKDLNRGFPGSPSGTSSQIYNYNLFHKIINKFNYLIDLHTASFGRVNSYYVRADMNDHISNVFAKLQQPQVILHNSGQDGTLRSAASTIGIKAITVEIGNPQLFQKQFVQWSYKGVMRILEYLNMFKSGAITDVVPTSSPLTILCSRGFWIYTKTGGVLEVYPSVNTVIKKGDLIARIKNIFGNVVDEIYCSHSGVAIGRSSNPVAMAGDRVLHLGIIKKENEVLAAEAKENY